MNKANSQTGLYTIAASLAGAGDGAATFLGNSIY